MTSEQWTDERLNKLADTADKNAAAINKLIEETKELNLKFTYYQQAAQWVVNLAFGLLASATIITIVTAVFPR